MSPLKNNVLIDTGIIIRFLRGWEKAKEFLVELELGDKNLFLSVITVFELYLGCKRDRKSIDKITKTVEVFKLADFSIKVAEKAAFLVDKYPQIFGKGVSRGVADAFIAASAWDTNSTLITLNTRHFLKIPINEIDIFAVDEKAAKWTALT